jgi:hypothetical protein
MWKQASTNAQNNKHTNHVTTPEHIESLHSNILHHTTKTYRETEHSMVQYMNAYVTKTHTTNTHTNKKPHHMQTTPQCREQKNPGIHDLDLCWRGCDATLKPAHSKQRRAKRTKWVGADKGAVCAAHKRISAHLLHREIRTQCHPQEQHGRGLPSGRAEFDATTGVKVGFCMMWCWGIQTFWNACLFWSRNS